MSAGFLKRNLLAENRKHEQTREAVRSRVVGRGLVLPENPEVDQSLEDVRNQEDDHIHQSALNQEGDRNRDVDDRVVLHLQLHIHLLLLLIVVGRKIDLSLIDAIGVCHLRSQRRRHVQKVRKGVTDRLNRLVDHIVQRDRGIHVTIGDISKMCASKKI
jgi:hypothetical protein